MPSTLSPFVRGLAALSISCAIALGQCATPWVSNGGVAGVASRGPDAGTVERIRATTMWDPDGPGPASAQLVVLGFFTVAGNVVSPSIAAWDPLTGVWSAIGPTTFASTSDVFAVVGLPNGDLVVGGNFTTVNGVAANRVARWNGTSWAPLGAGLDGVVYCLAVLPNGTLVAGGTFTGSGAVTANRVAQWDGVAWTPLGTGIASPPPSFAIVRSLTALPNGEVIAGGNFGSAGGVPVNNIARWNGAVWSPLGSGIPMASWGTVHHVAYAPNGDLFAGGYFTTASGAPGNSIVRWNGSAWSALGVGTNFQIRSLHIAANGHVFAGGSFTTAGGQPAGQVARWDGATWAPLGSGVEPSTPYDSPVTTVVGLPGGDLVVAGQFLAAGGVPLGHIARWNGSAWFALAEGINRRVTAVTTTADGFLVVGGAFAGIGGTAAARIAQRFGTTWLPLGAGLDREPNDLARLPNGDIVAATANSIARWDGIAWSAFGTGLSGGGGAYALAVLPNGDLVLGGDFTTVSGVAAVNLAVWNGTVWAPFGGGTNGSVVALAVMPNGDLVIGGFFTTASGVPANGIARWNGSSWSALGSGIAAGIYIPRVSSLLALPNGDLVIGGFFTTASGVPANGIARWNGTSWSAFGSGMGPGISFDVLALARLPTGDIVAGGGFSTAGGITAYNLARWNGSAWSAYGAGPDSYVFSIATLPNGDIAIGGSFLTVDSTVSAFVAEVTTTCPATATPFGVGCVGSAGFNSLTPQTLPWLGSTCRTVVNGAPTNSVVIVALGLGTLAQPLAALLPEGVAGCSLLVTPDVLLTVLPAAGIATIDLPIPNSAALVGAVIHEQALPYEFVVHGLAALTSSNAVSLMIGSY